MSVCVLFVSVPSCACVGARVHGWEHGVYLGGSIGTQARSPGTSMCACRKCMRVCAREQEGVCAEASGWEARRKAKQGQDRQGRRSGFREVKQEVQGEAMQASSKAGLEEGRQSRKGGKTEREASGQTPGTDHTSCPPHQGIQTLVQGGRREQCPGWEGW